MTLISRFSFMSVMTSFAITALIVILYMCVIFIMHHGKLDEIIGNGVLGIMAPVAGLCLVGIIFFDFFIIFNIIFRRGAAVFIQDDCIIYIDRIFFRLPVNEVSVVEIKKIKQRFWTNTIIRISTLTGKHRDLPAIMLDLEVQDVADKIRKLSKID